MRRYDRKGLAIGRFAGRSRRCHSSGVMYSKPPYAMKARTIPSEVPCRGGRGIPSVSRTRPRRASLTTLLSSRHEVGRDIVLTDHQLLFGFLEKPIPEGYLFCLRECQVFIQAQASKDSIFAGLPQSFVQACLHLLPNFLHPTAHLCTVEQQNLPCTRNNDQ